MRLLFCLTCFVGVIVSGCQNALTVRVERVIGVSSVSPHSELGRQLRDAIAGLTNIVSNCQDLEVKISRSKAGGELGGYAAALKSLRERASDLRTECKGYLEADADEPKLSELEATLLDVVEFGEKRERALREWQRTFPDELKGEISRLRIALQTTEKAAEPRFGGFIATDIHPITPSDPAYARILKSRSPVLELLRAPFFRDTSFEPLTEATVGVSGDSTIMLVMEQPGQWRVFQVSNDPAQLTRNVAFLVSKATSAAAKYLTPATAP